VDRDEIRGSETLIEVVDQFRTELGGAFFGDVGIEDNQIHPETVEAFGDFLADTAEADDTKGFVIDFIP